MPIVEFLCPDCGRHCRVSEEQRAVQHETPVCNTWIQNKGKAEEFLRLALMAKGAPMLALGRVKVDVVPDKKEPLDAGEYDRNEVLEQIYEGMKKL